MSFNPDAQKNCIKTRDDNEFKGEKGKEAAAIHSKIDPPTDG